VQTSSNNNLDAAPDAVEELQASIRATALPENQLAIHTGSMLGKQTSGQTTNSDEQVAGQIARQLDGQTASLLSGKFEGQNHETPHGQLGRCAEISSQDAWLPAQNNDQDASHLDSEPSRHANQLLSATLANEAQLDGQLDGHVITNQFGRSSQHLTIELVVNHASPTFTGQDSQPLHRLSHDLPEELLNRQLTGQLNGSINGQITGQLVGPLNGQITLQLIAQAPGISRQLSGQVLVQLTQQPNGQLSGQITGQLTGQLAGQLQLLGHHVEQSPHISVADGTSVSSLHMHDEAEGAVSNPANHMLHRATRTATASSSRRGGNVSFQEAEQESQSFSCDQGSDSRRLQHEELHTLLCCPLTKVRSGGLCMPDGLIMCISHDMQIS